MISENIAFTLRIFRLMFIVLATTFHDSWATNFYFSAVTGDDSRNFIQAKNPNTPWKSLTKLNEIFGSLQGGDTVFLKRNEIFYGSIQLRSSGNKENPIVVSAYGEGGAPVISGWIDLVNWDSHGNGIYRTSADLLLQKINILMVNGQPQEMGRFPNWGFIPFQKGELMNSVELNDAISPSKLQDATMVIRKNHWIIDKHKVVAIKENQIEFSGESKYGLISGFGLFFQDHLQTLDTVGEWFHDVERKGVFVYFGDVIPSEHKVKVGAIDYLVTNTQKVQHLVLENLCFSGANKTAIHLVDAKAIQIKNCSIEYSGENSLTAITVPELTVSDSKIHYAQNNGLFLRYGTPNAVIKNNVIEKIHLFPGMGSNGDSNGVGIHSLSDDGTIASNVISEIGYSGIVFSGNRSIVEQNYIDSFCLVKNDGGGIYSYEGSANKAYVDRKIIRNIIVNGMGNVEGTINTSKFSKPQVDGIYIDDNASGIEITNNSVAHVRRNGINLHNARNIIIKGNTFYNAQNQFSMSHDEQGDPVRNIQVLDNLFCTSSETQKILSFSSIKDDLNQMAQFKDNVYAYPENNEFVFQIKNRSGEGGRFFQSFNIRQWEKGPFRNQDVKSVFISRPSYRIESQNEIRENIQMRKGPMDIRCIGKNCSLTHIRSGQTSGYDIKIKENKTDSGIHINVGTIDPGSQYILRMKTSTAEHLIGHAVLRHKGHPWTNISDIYSFGIDPSTRVIEKVFSFPDEAESGAVILTIENENGAFRIENIDWIEADITFERPEVLFHYNPTNKQKTIKLSGNYFDARRKEVQGELTLEPFSSTILFPKYSSVEPY